MPNRPKRKCTTPGCPGIADSGRCDDCRFAKRQAKRRREKVHTYYGPAWPARRLDYLARHPRCCLCGRASMIPDHHPRSRRQLIAARVADPDADEHLRPLCHRCHAQQTAIHQPGGWARDRERP